MEIMFCENLVKIVVDQRMESAARFSKANMTLAVNPRCGDPFNEVWQTLCGMVGTIDRHLDKENEPALTFLVIGNAVAEVLRESPILRSPDAFRYAIDAEWKI